MKKFTHILSFTIVIILIIVAVLQSGRLWMIPAISVLSLICFFTREKVSVSSNRLDVTNEDVKKILDTYN